MRIAVIGAGSWGTALANLLAKKGLEVILWAYERELVERLQTTWVNDLYLAEIKLDGRMQFTADLAAAVNGRQVVVLVSPSQVMRRVVEQLRPHLERDCLLVSAAKGIDNDTLLLMSEVLEQVLGGAVATRCAYLSGPSFAREVAAELPTAVAIAADDGEVARTAQELFHTDYFRVYTNPDVVGTELGGALKNVIALAVSLYYYLMVVRAVYLLEPASELPMLPVSPVMKLLAGTLVAFMVVCGLYPTLILELSSSAAAVLVK